MTVKYKLTNLDFLEYQLYTSSKSKLHKKRRFRSRILVPIIYLLLGLFLVNKNSGLGIVFVGIGILWFVFHPLYSKWSYKRHFTKHVKENYKNQINKPIEIDFEDDFLKAKDFTSESKINGSELKELVETQNHFFIKLTTDVSLVVPKQLIEDETGFKKHITALGAEYIDELKWKWK